MFLNKKNFIKIPNYINLIFFKKFRVLLLKSKTKIKLLNLKFNICCLFLKNRVFILYIFSKIKKIRSFNNYLIKLIFLIKNLTLEIKNKFFKKLKLNGIGYKILEIKNLKNKLLIFKLGFSHSIYIKCLKNIIIFCLKNYKIFISGNNYYNIINFSKFLKKLKKINPYNGKGLIDNNNISNILFKQNKKL
jgi:ribosomal protein L6P/L9E